MHELLFLLLPLAAFSGWLIGRRSAVKATAPKFYANCNYPISDYPDPAIDTLLDMPNVDKESIYTHLTLGNVFRKRGELGRAIRLHQGLLERASIPSEQKSLAQLELARDYLAAGVLDRAEDLLLDLVSQRNQLPDSLHHLLELYQQGKDWLSAIKIAKQLQDIFGVDNRSEIAHFYCELADQELKISAMKQAKSYIKHALRSYKNCARALILRARIEQKLGNYNKAIKMYNFIAGQDIDYFAIIINDLIKCYQMADVKSKAFDFAKATHNSTKYQCSKCGFIASDLQWHCPSCKGWDLIKPVPVS